jgi:hypothetical protein
MVFSVSLSLLNIRLGGGSRSSSHPIITITTITIITIITDFQPSKAAAIVIYCVSHWSPHKRTITLCQGRA